MHRLYDGPHLYPQETVLFLIDDGFIQANADTLPWGWRPSHTRPASHIRDAFEEIASVWGGIEAAHNERKIMILALIGVMTTQHRRRLIGYNTTSNEDVPGPVRIDSILWTHAQLFPSRFNVNFKRLC